MRRFSFSILLLLLVVGPAYGGDDPWGELQGIFAEPGTGQIKERQPPQEDPWARLRAIYLPFSEEEEAKALHQPEAAVKVSGHLLKSVEPYEDVIRQASFRFHIPVEVISAVIYIESAGQAGARAKGTSAKGLMQTIDSTFAMARAALQRHGVVIVDDPFDPRASILAGSWYLNHMYEQAQRDRPEEVGGRDLPESWRLPAQYYYAGPGHGRKRADKVVVYRGGQPKVVDKKAYSDMVLKWAEIMRQGAAESRS